MEDNKKIKKNSTEKSTVKKEKISDSKSKTKKSQQVKTEVEKNSVQEKKNNAPKTEKMKKNSNATSSKKSTTSSKAKKETAEKKVEPKKTQKKASTTSTKKRTVKETISNENVNNEKIQNDNNINNEKSKEIVKDNKLNKKLKIKRLIMMIIFLIIVIILMLIGKSYSLYVASVDGSKTYGLRIGVLDFEIQNEKNSIRLYNGYPMKDSEGKNLIPYKFNIKNTGTLKANYTLSLIDDANEKINCIDCEFLSKDKLKVELKENGNVVFGPALISSFDEAMYKGTINAGATNEYELRIWLDYENTIISDAGKYYYGKIKVDMEQKIRASLSEMILKNNKVSTTPATLTTASNIIGENGLFVTNNTNSGKPTYFFRGNVNNNNLSFAGLNWKIVRINEDGTIRIVLNDLDNLTEVGFDEDYSDIYNGYYSNSYYKEYSDNWYNEHLANYDSYIATGMFCEAAKVMYEFGSNSDFILSGLNANMTPQSSYISSYECETDGNGYGTLYTKIGHLTIDDVIHAGINFDSYNADTYLYYGGYNEIYTMSIAGWFTGNGFENYPWMWGYVYKLENEDIDGSGMFRPVINLNSDVQIRGTGTESDPYVVIVQEETE